MKIHSFDYYRTLQLAIFAAPCEDASVDPTLYARGSYDGVMIHAKSLAIRAQSTLSIVSSQVGLLRPSLVVVHSMAANGLQEEERLHAKHCAPAILGSCNSARR